MKRIFSFVALVLMIPGFASATVLGDAAATMVAGEWKEITTGGVITSGWLADGTGSNALGYCPKGVWDNTTRRYFTVPSAGHGCVPGSSNCPPEGNARGMTLVYSADNNSWTKWSNYNSGNANGWPFYTDHT